MSCCLASYEIPSSLVLIVVFYIFFVVAGFRTDLLGMACSKDTLKHSYEHLLLQGLSLMELMRLFRWRTLNKFKVILVSLSE